MLQVIKQHIKATKYNIHTILEILHYSKNLFNEACFIYRQNFFSNRNKDKKDWTYIHYENLYKLLKNSENFKLLQSHIAQQVLKSIHNCFQSFYALITIKLHPNLPKYLKKNGYYCICDPDNNKRITKNKKNNQYYYTIPMSKNFLNGTILKDGTIIESHKRIKIKVPKIILDKDIHQICIIPKANGNYIEIHYIYDDHNIMQDQSDQTINKNIKSILSIDLGINNLCTCIAFNPLQKEKKIFNAFIIDGKKLKSYNQWYNKEISRLKSIASKDANAPRYTKKMYNITVKRNNRINDYIHKSCKKIINYCLDNNIQTIILGYNQNIKQNINMETINNQNFVNIPYYTLKENLQYKCNKNKIQLILQEESYTSKASSINFDYIPTYNIDDEKAIFTGRRKYRGLYIAQWKNKKIKINADVNGALNVMRKAIQNGLVKSKLVNEFILRYDINRVLESRGVLITPIRKRII